jgi:cellulose synthase/poly-beta-1,6-N-acetylglucosamine synthase-like glycosyltransferase
MVSIIVCTYNDSDWLLKALPSCLIQDIEKEILLIDDCSTAAISPAVMQMIHSNGIVYIKHPVNKGLSAARNTGITMAKYDWVIPLDADDWFYPNSIRKLWDARDGVDIVTGNCTDSGTVYAPAVAREALSETVFRRENPMICTSLFTKDIWRRAGGYMVKPHPHYEDWNFWAKCFKAGAKVRYLPFNVYNHTSRADSMLRQLHPHRERFVRMATEGVF